MKRTLLIFSVIITLTSCFSEPTVNKDVVRIFVAWPGAESLPHYKWDANAPKPSGVEPEFIELVLKRAGLEYEYVADYNYEKDGDPRIDVLTDGKADISIRGITITEERKEKALFSSPYYVDGLGIMATKNSQIESVADLEGKNVYAHSYTTAFPWVSENLPNATLITYRDGQEVFTEPEQLLREGKIDAYIIDYSFLKYVEKTNPDLKVLVGKLTSEEIGVAISKTRNDLLLKINKAISELKEEGALEKLKKSLEG